MKHIILLLTIILSGALSAQVAIGKTSVDGSGLLDFGTDTKGILLYPAEDVSTITTPTPGTIAFDGATGSFRYYDGTSWSADESGGITGGHIVSTDLGTQGVIIGAETSTAKGVLILEHSNRALILPKIAGKLKVETPVKGLMYYDTLTNTINVYNGVAWASF